MDSDISNRFTYHAPDAAKARQHEQIRFDLAEIAQRFADRLPASRETSLALTKLEEAMFWANAALARN